MGKGREGAVPECRRSRHACQRLGCSADEVPPNKDEAVKLVEFLVGSEAQGMYASINHEYRVDPKVEPSATVKSWGALKPNSLPPGDISKHRKTASEMSTR